MVGVQVGVLWGADSAPKFHDRSQLRVHTGTTDADISAGDLTSQTVCLTIEPAANTALRDVKVVFDLDKATTGWSTNHTTETIQFLVARKVDGTNWRVDIQGATTATSGTASDKKSMTVDIGAVGPDEDVRVYLILSAEGLDFELPYVCYYRSHNLATFTDVAN